MADFFASDPVRAGVLPTVADLLVDPSVSFALKDVILIWDRRDPVDAARDARLLAEVFERRAVEAVSWAP